MAVEGGATEEARLTLADGSKAERDICEVMVVKTIVP